MKNKITLKNSVKIIDNKYVIKKKKQSLNKIYEYLKSRNIDYFPNIIKEDNDNIYYEYIESITYPNEQKIIDLMLIMSDLHNKTTIYKEVDLDYYKYLYESLNNQINDMSNYYNTLISNIDTNIYMSPSNYLIARNISIVYKSLDFAKKHLDIWYKSVKDRRKVRLTVIHNNLAVDHYIKNNHAYLISWDNTKVDMPIYDLITLYKYHALDFDFKDILKIYFDKYPYTEEEITLFLTIIAIPSKIELSKTEYENVINIRKKIDYLYKTSLLLAEYRIKEKTNKTKK